MSNIDMSLVITAEDKAAEARAAKLAQITVERDRRISGGFTFEGVEYQTRPEDLENMAGAATSALEAIVNGALPGDLRWDDPNVDFAWIAADNSLTPMDAQTTLAMGKAAKRHKQLHIFTARQMKNLAVLPDDFTDDAHWPA
ncbi:hypothetical protein GCM10011415_27960 [Salipiger pallidus]|uniref:DUF4376 domain-containing protein n=1 Tax=Salipiger pallidus TaxID=1775170 RepID=A0A8J2ZLF9_9RHOB|nr:DUF4376 domain-containing protein [Salipiger pallidus]GGG77464.1 hypothetical protein GCM10011415_27960 [Salipiger pallidus]